MTTSELLLVIQSTVHQRFDIDVQTGQDMVVCTSVLDGRHVVRLILTRSVFFEGWHSSLQMQKVPGSYRQHIVLALDVFNTIISHVGVQ